MLRSIKSQLTRVAIGGAILAMPAAALADVLVVRSIGPSAGAYKPGRKLADTTAIALRAGDQLTLLDNKGTRTLKGPGSFTASSSGTPANNSLASIASQPTQRRARTGAVRDVRALADPVRPNIWMVDAGTPGTVCVPSGDAVSIWRKDAEVAGATTITGAGGTGTIDWIKGQSMQPWPTTLPLQPGATYTLKGTSAAAAGTTLKFAMVANPPADLSGLGGVLIESGCTAQLDMLLATSNGG